MSIEKRMRQACREVEEALQEGLAECRRGRFNLGCFSNTSPAGQHFATAYETWMRLRANAKDQFALSLGYGR